MNMSIELLESYLDDALGDAQTAQVETALRQSEPLRQELRRLIQERDRGEHSVGAVWRRERLTCLSRSQLGSYLLGVLESDVSNYIEFHLDTVGCAFCQANLADLKSQQQDAAPAAKRRRRYFDSSAGLLQK